jgi:hypothetical protein
MSGADEYHGLPTARTTLRIRYVRVLVICNSCRHQSERRLRAIVARDDLALAKLRLRCSQCGTYRTDFVLTSRDAAVARHDSLKHSGLTPRRRRRRHRVIASVCALRLCMGRGWRRGAHRA